MPPPPIRRAFGAALLAAALVAAPCARGDDARAAPPAQAGDDARQKRALELFDQSSAAYDAGRFGDAIALLKEAYALRNEPVLLYNLGRAYEGLGDLASAADAYEKFLAAEPHAPDRGALEQRIATLRRQLAEREALRRQALARQRARPPAPAKRPSAVPWIVAGVGVAGLAAGGVFRYLATDSHDRAVEEPTYAEADRLQTQAETFATVSNVSLVAGGALVVVGVVWGLLDLSASGSPRRATALAAPGGLRVTF